MVIIPGNSNAVALILNIGFLLALMSFIRYVIGFKYWRNYSALTLTISAYLFSLVFTNYLIGLLFWIYLFTITILFASITRRISKNSKMNYYARLGLIYTGGILGLLFASVLLTHIIEFNPLRYNFSTISLLLIITALDDLTILKLRKSSIEAIRRIIITFLIAITGSLIMSATSWNTYLYTHQEIFVLALAILLIIAKWRHINLIDILRFKDIINKTND